ncbi:NAD(P)/FAD-dependent oxidoreductase [Saccharibacillus alkalitolerans]|uniref:Ferredoxin--NADP reductase n=1 Tax=Saccharibacillus alkalitolerans TaxID=2705290 RepID=A0ABX0F0X4_9BACL|nr:NAD(P)/FAD-dependent oxidoreductase [Saccharibacillus alkalitolerans]NGZ74633.1 NAD(P)/FAD-dependent oxidoreductase [Saccharibacillus alkalitolerans]
MGNHEVWDVTIIGGGPAGLFSAFYSGLREMKTKIIEFQPFLGGKVHVYPEKMIWDVGGLTPVPGAKLIEQMVAQGQTFKPDVVLNEKVTSLSRSEDDDHFVLHTLSGELHRSKTIILAVGGGILKPIKLEIEGAERFEVTNLHYTVKSISRFKDKTVLISGGGHSAVDWANELAPFAKKVYLTYRKEELKGHEADVTKMRAHGVELLLSASIKTLVAGDDHSQIRTVLLEKNGGREQFKLEVDDVIISHGYERDTELLKQSDIKMEMNEYQILGSSASETSVPGIFAAGDILHHEGKLHLIAGAFQDAANAVNKAKQFLKPDAPGYGMVSSHNELFKEKNREIIKELYNP